MVPLHSLRLFLVVCLASMLALFVSVVSALPQVQTQIFPLHSIDGSWLT